MVERDIYVEVIGSNPILFFLFFTRERWIMNIEELFHKSCSKAGLYLKQNASTILTCVGAAGVVGTTVTAVKATPKAIRLLEEAKDEKGEDLTKLEVVKVAGPAYIPSVLLGASTIACIFGANTLNKRQQAAIMSAYALLDNSYKEYKAKVRELYGEDADIHVRQEIVKDKYEDEDINLDDGLDLFYDEFSGRYFESTMEDVLAAEYELNHLLAQDSGVFLNEFYELLGIDTVDYGDYLGWSSFELVESYWYCWVEFEHTKVTMDDGLECTIITILKEPTFDFENY